MSPSTINPFEPPRTTELDGSAAPAPGRLVVSAQARDELVRAAPWVRRLVRLTMLSIAIQVFGLVGALARLRGFAATVNIVALVGVNIAVWTLFLLALRRYADASERLRAREAGALGAVLAAQLGYLKLAGVSGAIAAGIILFRIAVGIGTGDFLSWVYR